MGSFGQPNVAWGDYARFVAYTGKLNWFARPAVGPVRTSPADILPCLEQLYELLREDSARANTVLRQILEPITMTPVEEKGRRFYRATGAAKGAEMLDRLGLTQAVDFGGCEGRI